MKYKINTGSQSLVCHAKFRKPLKIKLFTHITHDAGVKCQLCLGAPIGHTRLFCLLITYLFCCFVNIYPPTPLYYYSI